MAEPALEPRPWDGYRFYAESMNRDGRERLDLEAALRRAIERNELEVYYQPQYELKVNTYTTDDQVYPAVATDSDGNFVVVWQSEGSSGTDSSFYSIQGQRYAWDGVAIGGEFQVNTYTTNDQVYSEVATDSDGNFVVVWRSEGSSGTDSSFYSIQGQRYAWDGAAIGGEFQVNTYTTGRQVAASVAAAPRSWNRGSSGPASFALMGGVLTFTATDPDHGRELWRSDGTEAGTWLLKDLNPGPDSSDMGQRVVAGGVLYFVALDPVAGRELWRSNGTAEGTHLVVDLRPGIMSSLPEGLSPLPDGDLLFTAYSEDAGVEVWRTDGTAVGTRRVTDIAPGPESSSPSELTVRGDWVVFAADDGSTGRELWAYRWRTESPLFADGFESGDTTAWQ